MRVSKIRNALIELQQQSDNGVLMPVDVVKAARPVTSPLHNCFDWNDSTASQKYRLWQARQLIVSVRIAYDDKGETIAPVFVSLKPDRKDGGYRALSDVLSSKEWRTELLKTAMDELKTFQERFDTFQELAAVFKAIRRVEKKVTKKNGRTAPVAA
jgi:hypothetical protein